MADAISLISEVSANFRISLSWALLGFGVIVLTAAAAIVWQWKSTKPKDEKFWFASGVCFSWLYNFNDKWLFLLSKKRAMSAVTEDLLVSGNLILLFIAACFYTRALTNHNIPVLWKYAGSFFAALTIIIFLF